SGLNSMGLPATLKKELHRYRARLPARCQKVSLYPALLEQLAELQEQALDELRDARPNLIQRLRGAGRTQQEAASEGLRAELSQVLQRLVTAIDPQFASQDRLKALSSRITPELHLNDVPALLEQTRELVLHAWLATNE